MIDATRHHLPALAPARTIATRRADGAIELAHPDPLALYPAHLGHCLREQARTKPDQVFLGAPHADGSLDTLTYRAAANIVDRLSQALIDRGLSAERPLAIIAENSIPFACLKLAAMQVGIPIAPISTAYARHGANLDKIDYLLDLLAPGAIAFDATLDVAMLRAAPKALRIGLPGAQGAHVSYDALTAMSVRADVDARFAAVAPDDTAKILFTSGSTGMPKGVITTHRMLVSNIAAMRQQMPYLARGPVIVDWLPWNHCFGGNYNFNLALVNGGSYYLDPSRPVDGAFTASKALLAAIQPTLYLNVPVGYERLADTLEADPTFAARFFERIHALFYAGSSMPAPLWSRLEALAERTLGRRVMLFTSYGSTESAPGHTLAHWPTDGPSHIGVPMPASSVLLIPCEGDQYEIRMKGPNITPGYLRDAERTRALFDAEGWLITNDAVSFVDAAQPEQGLRFHGRLGGNFKLLSGSWVPTDEIRIAAIAHGAGLVRDAIVTGHDRAEVGLLLFIDPIAAARVVPNAPDFQSAARDPIVHSRIEAAYREYNLAHRSGTRRIGRFAILDEPAERYASELTDKGYLNQTQARHARADRVEALYAQPAPDGITVLP